MEKVNRVIIFTEGGDNIGFGHITRCSALYEEIESRGIEVEFVVFGKNVEELLKDKKYQNIDWKNKEFLNNFLRETDYVIIDSYLADLEIYNFIVQRVKRVVCLDDYNRLDYPEEAIIINLCFKSLSRKNYYYGMKYIILRKEFLLEKINDNTKNEKDILIIIGGNDIRNITGKLITLLKKNYSDYHLNVVTQNKRLKEILTLNDKIYMNLNAKEIITLIKRCYIAISGCGQTLFELSRIGIGTIGIKIADNQNDNVEYFSKKNYLEYAGSYLDEKLEENLLEKIKKLEECNYNDKKVKIGQSLTEEINGSKNIIDLLVEEKF